MIHSIDLLRPRWVMPRVPGGDALEAPPTSPVDVADQEEA